MTKKTETIEIRVSPELKEQLGSLSKSRGQPMSAVVRDLLHQEINALAQESKTAKDGLMKVPNARQAGIAGLAVAGVMIMAMGMNMSDPASSAVGSEARMAYAEMDANHDGSVTRAEYYRFGAEMKNAYQISEVAVADMPGNGVVTIELPVSCEQDFDAQFGDGPGNPLLPDFSEIDLDGDGFLTVAEIHTALTDDRIREFRDLDADGDEFLTLAEVRDSFARDTEMALSPACEKVLADYRIEEMSKPAEIKEDLHILFSALDADGNDKVSLPEFLASGI